MNDVISTAIDSPKPRRFGRQAEVLLGIVFIASALLKAADVNLFIVQIDRYGVMVLAFQALVALLVLFVETSLGMLLLLGLWRRFTLVMTVLLLLFFTEVVLYGWLYLNLDDCGCMGIVKMPPWVSLIKNLVLIVLAVEAWRGLVRPRAERPPRSRRRLWGGVGRAFLALVAAVSVTGYATARVDPVRGGDLYRYITFEANGRTWDLGKGEYFVVVLSMTCPHCHEVVAPLNDLTKREGFPPVVGICKRDARRYDKFVSETKPVFPLHMMPVRDFYHLVGFAFPRFALIRDGAVVKVWDGELPPVEEVEKARAQSPAQPKA